MAPRIRRVDTSCPENFCRGPEGSAKAGAEITKVCFQCFNSFDESFEKWFRTIGRYQEGKSIADAIETYAPASGNDNTANGDYHDIISDEILGVAKLSGDDKVQEVKTQLGCR